MYIQYLFRDCTHALSWSCIRPTSEWTIVLVAELWFSRNRTRV